MSTLHPTFQRIIDTAPHAPPVICRRCDDVQQQAAIAADLALDRDKAHRKNNEDFARALKLQAQQMDCGVLS